MIKIAISLAIPHYHSTVIPRTRVSSRLPGGHHASLPHLLTLLSSQHLTLTLRPYPAPHPHPTPLPRTPTLTTPTSYTPTTPPPRLARCSGSLAHGKTRLLPPPTPPARISIPSSHSKSYLIIAERNGSTGMAVQRGFLVALPVAHLPPRPTHTFKSEKREREKKRR